jgi:hypothetical protein
LVPARRQRLTRLNSTPVASEALERPAIYSPPIAISTRRAA